MTAELVDPEVELDPRRWIILAILLLTVVLIAIDTSVLNVSIPTILREMHTTVPTLEWVIAGYSLTFASLLIVGGRLGDIFGHRRLFGIGASLFGIGSLIAATSPNVGVLILGEAVIEGIGAALMTPSTLALLSNTFRGRERATAFAAWGAAAGAAVAFGPLLGGFLTTNYSWRWAFAINVIVAPITVIGVILLIRREQERSARMPIDVVGAMCIASGMFLLVFSLSQGPRYGWWRPISDLEILGHTIWTTQRPVSVSVVSFALALIILFAFVRLEMRKERNDAHPLFEFSQLRHTAFRYGLITSTILSLGQLGVLFALPIFLQDARGLTAQQNGLWMVPLGVCIIIGAQVGNRLIRRVGTTNMVRTGLFVETVAIVSLVYTLTPTAGPWRVLPGMALFGLGVGFASSQLTNVVLSQIAADKTGVASGANSTSRQAGAALGAAVMGSLIAVLTTNNAIDSVRASDLPVSVQDRAVETITAVGTGYRPDLQLPEAARSTLRSLMDQSLTSATKATLGFAAIVVFAGALLSLLIPRVDTAFGDSHVEVPLPEETLTKVPID